MFVDPYRLIFFASAKAHKPPVYAFYRGHNIGAKSNLSEAQCSTQFENK